MPSFPTSVFSPTTKAAAQVIQPAHVNDLQDEVVAIETGLINGPLTLASVHVTGNSTLANVNVTGGSTLATLQVSGASTFASRPEMPPPDAVRLALNANIALVHNTTLAVQWSTAHIATNSSLHSTTTNPQRITPQSTGVYAIHVTLQGGANVGSTASLTAFIEDSSGTVLGSGNAGIDAGAFPLATAFALKRFDVVGSTQWVRVVALSLYAASTQSVSSSLSFCHFYKL